MKYCDNDMCIYWKNNICSLDTILLDARGACTDCINITLDEELREAYREKLLKHYHGDVEIITEK